MRTTENKDTERRIIDKAREVFIEKGFAEARMSDIAARTGINRPALHYYFRTKDRMFEAVFHDIVNSFMPAIHDIIVQDKPVRERIADVVDIYVDVMERNPNLPIFMVREIHRDVHHLLDTVSHMEAAGYMRRIIVTLNKEIACGRIRRVPVDFVFYTFYGLLFAPFLARPLAGGMFARHGHDADAEAEWHRRWKEHVTKQMADMLCG